MVASARGDWVTACRGNKALESDGSEAKSEVVEENDPYQLVQRRRGFRERDEHKSHGYVGVVGHNRLGHPNICDRKRAEEHQRGAQTYQRQHAEASSELKGH